ncbi:16S rRNA (guanine(527)-N(7))-methyltransferase RsmG [Herbaspirillum rubrisubalbicans]|uniref:16S rRNA (guanine(527)-N(7))-methyltransferase RsmG n=1 Tax=Herbaspirillum rubrisubalbicans TaxID=80842 RepID=UPI0015595152|nr:16S rRNA (guanine(527)-N(7))-methyltransferase RsmG [Herbaspirillum rubrisubalbicans]NQE50787.1 16S rRNA methyltransferase [Herbaspirillum rubrisubalbicans]
MSNTADLNDLTRTLKEGATAMGLTLSAAQLDQLMAYQALLAKWNKVYNLTALRDPAQMVTHHLLDSLSAVSAFAGAQRVLDVGAGGGLPGIVLAIWAAQAQPQMKITLVDTVQKKTAFLNQVKAQLQLGNVTVLHARVEQLPVEQQYDVITSRAFAELKDFIIWSNHLLQPGGKYIALKGVLPQEEIDRLPAGWQVQHVQPLQVPGLDAERHLIFMERAT